MNFKRGITHDFLFHTLLIENYKFAEVM